MPTTKSLSDQITDSIGEQVAPLLPAILPEKAITSKKVELAESFLLWKLDLGYIYPSEGAPGFLATPTNIWHHQIKIGGEYMAYARSNAATDISEDQVVSEVVLSDLPKKIGAAIDKLED